MNTKIRRDHGQVSLYVLAENLSFWEKENAMVELSTSHQKPGWIEHRFLHDSVENKEEIMEITEGLYSLCRKKKHDQEQTEGLPVVICIMNDKQDHF